jgi:mannose-6-phosphate isomerase-like protein (cupin superfamily)
MSAYTVVNLKQPENAAARFGFEEHAEFRFGTEPLGLENCAVSYQRLAPNFRLPFGHDHERQEEVYVLVHGNARAKIGDDVVELARWDAVRVPPRTRRQFEAGPEGAEMVIVGAPVTGPGDAEVVQGWWAD